MKESAMSKIDCESALLLLQQSEFGSLGPFESSPGFKEFEDAPQIRRGKSCYIFRSKKSCHYFYVAVDGEVTSEEDLLKNDRT